ncbi:MAG: hypothetical protein GF418_17365 [Chitinivibrionales bacterium]|nr:hypothetical protein [Chitinivibrionales bacterium]MBD3397390.1 hypothetical protein [Chitinivibrionales bacterium]
MPGPGSADCNNDCTMDARTDQLHGRHMATIVKWKYVHTALRAAAVALVCAGGARAMEDVTITVHAGARQRFSGLGTSFNPGQTHFRDIHDSTKAEVMRFMFDDSLGLNTQYIRLWASASSCEGDESYFCARQHGYTWDPIITWARKYNPDVNVYLGPCGAKGSSARFYAASYAQHIVYLKELFGIDVMGTGIANEPDMHDKFIASEMPAFIKAFRQELDARGLDHVKIVAPETSGTGWKSWEMIDAINADPAAYAALDGYATHSYNESINEDIEERVAAPILADGKEYWMTEGSDFAIELWEDADQAAGMTSRWLADMNHLVTQWTFYMMMAGRNTNWENDQQGMMNGFHMILYRIEEQDVGLLLKGYYFLQVSRTIGPGAVCRKAVTNLMDVNPDKYWRREDTSMVFVYGEKAPLYLAAAVNTDGSWGIAATNYTGDKAPDAYTSLRPSADYRITVHVEELADEGDIVFRAHRCNATLDPGAAGLGSRYCHDEGHVTMHNGTFVIDSLGSFDLMTFRSPPDVSAAGPGRVVRGGSAAGMRVLTLPGKAPPYRIRYTAGSGPSRVRVSVYDMRGREVRGLVDRVMPPGTYDVSWDGVSHTGARAASGLYVVRLESAAGRATGPLVIER